MAGISMGVASVLEFQSLFVFIIENWVPAMTRHHTGSNIYILWTRNVPIDCQTVMPSFHDIIALFVGKIEQ